MGNDVAKARASTTLLLQSVKHIKWNVCIDYVSVHMPHACLCVLEYVCL